MDVPEPDRSKIGSGGASASVGPLAPPAGSLVATTATVAGHTPAGVHLLVLLLATGGLIGAMFPLGRLASQAGIAPLTWSFLIAAGAAAALSLKLVWDGRGLPTDVRSLRFYAVAGLVSYAVPNVLVFTVIPKLGAGFTSILFTLSPIFTLILAASLKLQRPTPLGATGIGLGFAGALLIVLSKGQLGHPAAPLWLGLALVIPLSLAAGNVYRTMDWPPGAPGLTLAVGTNAAAAVMLAAASLITSGGMALGPAMAAPGLVAGQIAVSASMFVLFFALQRLGGPVYLSQIGYVAAAVGLAAGSILGERYGVATWLGACVIAGGIALTTIAQRSKT